METPDDPVKPRFYIDNDGTRMLSIPLTRDEVTDGETVENLLQVLWNKAEALGVEIVDDPTYVNTSSDITTADFKLVETVMLSIPYIPENFATIAAVHEISDAEVRRTYEKAEALQLPIVAVHNFIAFGTRQPVKEAKYITLEMFETHYNLTKDAAVMNGWRKTKVKRGEHVREHIDW